MKIKTLSYTTSNQSPTVHDFIKSVAEKAILSKSVAADTPRIGIFWLILKDSKVQIFHSLVTTLEFGIDYGDFIISPYDHSSTWDSLIPHKIVPSAKYEYDYLPRGRIAYNTLEEKYYAYHGPWVNSSAKAVVKSEFKLPTSTVWVPDTHYSFKRWGFN